MDVEIRRAVAGDAAALALVAQATFLETYAHMIPREDMLVHGARQHGEGLYAEWLGRDDHRIWLAEAAGTRAPVGYAVLCPPDLPVPTADDDLELKRIYALHRLHGSGLGARLMAAAARGRPFR